jgi:RNA recognition motif-containing protein
MTNQLHGDDVQRIQIDNLPPSADEASLRALFEPYGEVVGYERPDDDQIDAVGAYVLLRMAVPNADEAIVALDGQKLDGQTLRVRPA